MEHLTDNSTETIDSLRNQLEAAHQNLHRLLEDIRSAAFSAARDARFNPDANNQWKEDEENASEAAFQQLAAIIELQKKIASAEVESLTTNTQGELNLSIDHTAMDDERFTGPGDYPAYQRKE